MSKKRHPLHPLVTDIAKKVGRMREDLEKIRGTLTKIRRTLERGFTDLHEAIYDNIEAQAELKLMERVAEVRSIPTQIEAEQERIEAEKDEIRDKLDAVSERYEQKHAELDQKATERVRNLGEHIFTILEDEFEDDIETPFVDALTPTWEELQAHNARVAGDRNMKLQEGLQQANTEIDAFLDHRETLLDDITDHRVSMDLSIAEPITLQIPFWVVTIEKGEEITMAVGPSYLKAKGDGWFDARVDPIEGFEEPIEQLTAPETGDDFAGSPPAFLRKGNPDSTHATRDSVSGSTEILGAGLDQYASSRYGGLVSFTKEFQRAVPDDAEIRVEGGSSDG